MVDTQFLNKNENEEKTLIDAENTLQKTEKEEIKDTQTLNSQNEIKISNTSCENNKTTIRGVEPSESSQIFYSKKEIYDLKLSQVRQDGDTLEAIRLINEAAKENIILR